MRGNITRRGKNSWRLKFDTGSDATGNRQTKYVTVKGKRQDAERELTRLLGAHHAGTLVEPSATTIAEYLRGWLDSATGLAGKTEERYRQLVEQQIIPHLGTVPLQRLKPVHIEDWHRVLLTRGGKDGAPLSARTVGHAHRVLAKGLAGAARAELVVRNVAALIPAPRVEEGEVEILTSHQIAPVLAALQDHWLAPIVTLALGSGMRRGEILALDWSSIDLDNATAKVTRSLEQTRGGLKFKLPKTKTSKRTVSLPPTTVEALRTHRLRQLELRLALGQGRADADTLVFTDTNGDAIPPNNLSRDWHRFVRSCQLPEVSFHALRHTHVSALIARGVDVLTISRRIGHANAATTLRIYGHMFSQNDDAAVDAIEAAFGAKA